MGLLLFVSRFMLGLMFVASGVMKAIMGFSQFKMQMLYGFGATPEAIEAGTATVVLPFMSADMASSGVATYLAIAVIALEIIGGLLVIIGRPEILSRLAGLLLGLFCLLAAVLYHAFWGIEDVAMANMQMIMFMKNISIAGGLFLLTFRGPNAAE